MAFDFGNGMLTNSGELRRAIRDDYRAEEAGHVRRLAGFAAMDARAQTRVEQRAGALIRHVRNRQSSMGGVSALMQEYDLSSEEGVVLMCLAEALLRIPDGQTRDMLIRDKISEGEWSRHLGSSHGFFVRSSTFGLMMAGRTLSLDPDGENGLERLVSKLGAPVIRVAITRAMELLGHQFVMGETIEAATTRARKLEARGYRYSYDMLGEAAVTMADADRYFQAYCDAIDAVGQAGSGDAMGGAGISVKLSALHPRYEFAQSQRVLGELKDRLLALCARAADQGIGLCIDAEESDRLDLSLELIEAAALDPATRHWTGLGLAVQAYQKRAFSLIDWLADLARRSGRRLLVRLVKGAYWDTEIKLAQMGGQPGYPVFTRKQNTDVSYLACARKLLADREAFHPCFATHNAMTVAAILEMSDGRGGFEFQRLHGMGETLYEPVTGEAAEAVPCRIYAPVGAHEDLLAYLVRRLLENGANSSFVNQICDEATPVETLTRDPIIEAEQADFAGHPRIPAPADLFGASRVNSEGFDFTDPVELARLLPAIEAAEDRNWEAHPVINGETRRNEARPVRQPADQSRIVGEASLATADDALAALAAADRATDAWRSRPVGERALMLRRAADLMEAASAELIMLIVREAGRSLPDAHDEIREAVDFLRFYAADAEQKFGDPQVLPGPTGERNTLRLVGRGPFLCIAPWNFPVAIFTGQIAAALAAGCPALAKPANQTPLTGASVIRILHEAGVPRDVLHFLPGSGVVIGNALLPDPRLSGVAFTGSTQTAHTIQKTLAERHGPIIPFIAETGGINAMIVDSTALPEQVTRDVVSSAFQSAGQRCSALRLLCVQDDVADDQIRMLAGAMQELRIGDPARLSTDVGPVIDTGARTAIEAHVETCRVQHDVLAECAVNTLPDAGCFVAPIAVEIGRVADLEAEVFGPVLHVVRWKAGELDQLVDDINALGYGLTLGLHTRSASRADRVAARARVGNIYVNRNQIGAVVGVQPFGGEGHSGTGPKAGGPHYLYRFAVERTVTIDTTAAGGNTSLMAMES